MNAPTKARVAAFLERAEIAAIMAALNRDGMQTRIIGGAVRDLLLGVAVGDVDLATTASPQETIRLGQAAGYKAVPTGIAHGTVTLVRDRIGFEVTTLRRDVATDGRHAIVAFCTDFREDALRRDFTINALGLDSAGKVHDYCDGLTDLAARRIRFIGEPGARIHEDFLRILRFFRFHARYGRGGLDPAGLAACLAGRAGLEGLSRERVRAELLKLLAAPLAADTLEAMAGAGLLMPVLGCVPQLARFRAIAQGGGGERVCPSFRLAALAVSVREDAWRLRERLRLSNDEADRIERLALALEGVSGRAALPDIAALRTWGHRVGADAVAGAMVLASASAETAGQLAVQALIAALGRTPRFLLSGRDVMALGVPSGPRIGRVLDGARRSWIEADCPADRAEQSRLLERALAASQA